VRTGGVVAGAASILARKGVSAYGAGPPSVEPPTSVAAGHYATLKVPISI
jgi:hypothetical protein